MEGFAVTCFGCVLSVAVFFSCFIAKLEAQTLKITSNPTGSTYVKPGENITLDITFDYTGSQVVQVDWRKGVNVLIRKNSGGTVLQYEKRAYLNGINFVLTNPEQKDNGKYTVELKADDVTTTVPPVDFVVIIQETPTAVTKCSTPLTLKEGEDFECLCNSTGGNPPPTASWYNGNKVISEPGNLKTTLSLKKITRYEAGTYSCIVESLNLRNEDEIKVQVQYGPTKVTLKPDAETIIGERFMLTCSASAFPLPKFTILHNGTDLKDNVKNGVLTIESLTLKDGGRYECIAKNSFGNNTASLTLSVREKDAGSKPLGAGVIVGIVIGVLVGIVIVIGVVYFLVCKSKKRKQEEAGSSGEILGQYEPVDKSKMNRGDGAGPSNDCSPPEEVVEYASAVVDKKKKKQQATAQSALPSVTYASLDPVALKPDGSKMHDGTREETNYASINLQE